MDSDIIAQVHKIKFFNPELSSINSLAYNPRTKKLAALRRRILKFKTGQSDAWSNIEIWDMSGRAPFLEQTIYEDDNNPGLLEAVIWTHDNRLLSCGLNGFLNEYDLVRAKIVKTLAVTAGPAWCMSANHDGSLLAVGTEEGYISVFSVGEEILFNKTMDRNDNRILCLSWYKNPKNEQFIVMGSIDYVKIYNYETERFIDHVKIGDVGRIVWCLTVMDDFTIIAGDSSGTTSFIQGKTASVFCHFKPHRADVLTMCATDQMTVFAAGVDPSIVKFSKTQVKGGRKKIWAQTITRNIHTHDVRAMAAFDENWLISGGIDSYLVRTRYNPHSRVMHTIDLKKKVNFGHDGTFQYQQFQYDKVLEVWQLQNTIESYEESGPVVASPIKMLEMKSKKYITCSAFYPHWIAYSNFNSFKVFNFSSSELTKVTVLCEPIDGVQHLQFCGNSYLAVGTGKTVYILKLDLAGITLERKIKFQDRIYMLKGCRNYLAISLADSHHSVHLFSIDNWSKEKSLFSNSYRPVDITFDNDEKEIWLAFADFHLSKYDIAKEAVVININLSDPQSSIVDHLRPYYPEDWPLKGVAVCKNTVLTYADNLMYQVDLETSVVNVCEKYRHIVNISNADDSRKLALVQLHPDTIFAKLPATLNKNKPG